MKKSGFFTRTEETTVTDEKGNYRTKTEKRFNWGRILLVFIPVLALAVFLSCIRIVPTGHTGIVVTFGKVEEGSLDSGPNFVLPWQKVVNLDNRVQKVNINTEAFSSDIQQVQVSTTINYSINAKTAYTLYKTVGKNYYDNIILPRALENVKAIFANYTAENLISHRESLSGEIVTAMKADMESYGITVNDISIEDIDFTEAFTDAVEAKQVAAQEKLTAQTKQEQLTMEQQAQAERDVIAAQAELEVTKIQAESAYYAGEKEAEVNKKIAESLTPELVQYYYVQQWNGQMPTTILGEASSFMLNLPN
ncbi:MAG: prohibitin family protein [Oscillospiraceae bacterium]|nr:prohibitin family protein [Oscillospiraceae bacterium]MBR3611511.1 prohibitin family protein [Oscillospiraceae bacterium]MBR3952295.1 prohibitin family protein [Oscillospiraceae bacterium]